MSTPSRPRSPARDGAFAAAAAPVIFNVAPGSGPTTGGTPVVITGSGFTGATAVRFGSTSAASYRVVSDAEIDAVTPPGSAGSVRLSVTTAGGTSSQSITFTYVAVPVPTLTTLAPSTGPQAGGTLVTLNGTGLTNASAVHFGAGTASFAPVSDTQINAVAPPGSGAVNVNVTTPGGTSGNLTYTYVPQPTVGQVTPSQGPATGGGTVSITGSNFTGVTDVRFGTVPATSYTVVSAGEIGAVVPSAAPGVAQVQVTATGGTSGAGPYYYFVAAPGISSLTPAQGPSATGGTVIITGTGLGPATSVRFGTATASFTVLGDTRISAVAPAGTGTADVTVTTPGGTSNALPYTRLAAPALTALSPTVGPTSGGTTLSITGSGLTTATAVRFGTASAAFTVVSDTQMNAVAPPGGGTVGVTVTTLGGTGGPLSYTYLAPPG